jgi:hypothetical protein
MTLARDISDTNLARTNAETDVKLNKTVTVAGGKFVIDGTSQAALSLARGSTYVFNVSDSSVSGHPFRFSTTSDGTHGGGSEYTTGVTISGTSTVTIAVASDAPDLLYYYCSNHSGMGGRVDIVDQHVLGFNGTSFVPIAAKRQLKSTRATNIEGGATGSIPYNTGASTTQFVGIGSANQALVVSGGIPAWATSVNLATNINGGSAGAIPYQSGSGATAFTSVGTAGQVLQSNGSSAPTFVDKSTIATPTGVASVMKFS